MTNVMTAVRRACAEDDVRASDMAEVGDGFACTPQANKCHTLRLPFRTFGISFPPVPVAHSCCTLLRLPTSAALTVSPYTHLVVVLSLSSIPSRVRVRSLLVHFSSFIIHTTVQLFRRSVLSFCLFVAAPSRQSLHHIICFLAPPRLAC